MPKHSDGHVKTRRTGTTRRTSTSCDNCRSRKTKCVDPIPGPCKYCATVSASCAITIKRKSRPFYLVSEEEYRYGIKILQKFFPDTELNLETLGELANTLDCDQARKIGDRVHLQERSSVIATPESASAHDPSISHNDMLGSSVINPKNTHETPARLINRQQGSLISDSLGITRYVGPKSDLVFISAVRSFAFAEVDASWTSANRIKHPMRHLPPATPESRSLVDVSTRPSYLPPRQDWNRHIEQYFSDINSTYWLIASESFCARLDSTYPYSESSTNASWACFLYTILALTSQTAIQGPPDHDNRNRAPLVEPSASSMSGHLTGDDYISMAKSLLKDVIDQANLDGVRALSAMSIYMYNQGFAVQAYLTVGTAIRIAYSLGLHQQTAYSEMITVQQDDALRIAWTLYQLDCDISRPTGRPCNIHRGEWQPAMPINMAMSSGIYDPWGLIQSSITFNLEDISIFEKLSKHMVVSDQNTVEQEIESCVDILQNWYRTVPQHLQWNTPVAPPHRRPICRLHLRYWSMIIFSTRLVLLADMQSIDQLCLDQEPKLSSLGQICLDACEQSLEILETMHSSNDLSSLTVVDTKSIIDVSMVFLLLSTRWPNDKPRGFINRCMELLQSMEDIGFCKFARRDMLMVIESYDARIHHGQSSTDIRTDHQEPHFPSRFADFDLDIFSWNQERTTAAMGWGFIPWELGTATENSLQNF